MRVKLSAVIYPQVQDHPLLDGFMVPDIEILIDYFQINIFSFYFFATDGCHVTKSSSNFILSDYPTKIISRHCQAIFPKKITKCVIQDDLIVAKQL